MSGPVYPNLPSDRNRGYEPDYSDEGEGSYSASESEGSIYQDKPLSLPALKKERWVYVCDMVESNLKMRSLMDIKLICDELLRRSREDGIVDDQHVQLSASATTQIDRLLVFTGKLTGLIKRVDAQIRVKITEKKTNNNGGIND